MSSRTSYSGLAILLTFCVTHIPYTSHAGRRKGRCRKEEGSIRIYIASVGETLSNTQSTLKFIEVTSSYSASGQPVPYILEA
jgi:hypothetical protein